MQHINTGQNDKPLRLPDGLGSSWDITSLVGNTVMRFDPGDKANGSLYVCSVGGRDDKHTALISLLREQDLWSAVEPKEVREDQKETYKAQLKLTEVREYRFGGEVIILARCDHPKFPSNDQRWKEWNAVVKAAADTPPV